MTEQISKLDVNTLEYVLKFVKNERDISKSFAHNARENNDREDEIYWKANSGALNMTINFINETIRDLTRKQQEVA